MINKSYRWKVLTDKDHLKEPDVRLGDYECSHIHLNDDSNFESEEEALKALEEIFQSCGCPILLKGIFIKHGLTLVAFYNYEP